MISWLIIQKLIIYKFYVITYVYSHFRESWVWANKKEFVKEIIENTANINARTSDI